MSRPATRSLLAAVLLATIVAAGASVRGHAQEPAGALLALPPETTAPSSNRFT
jgi:hypothetical protein